MQIRSLSLKTVFGVLCLVAATPAFAEEQAAVVAPGGHFGGARPGFGGGMHPGFGGVRPGFGGGFHPGFGGGYRPGFGGGFRPGLGWRGPGFRAVPVPVPVPGYGYPVPAPGYGYPVPGYGYPAPGYGGYAVTCFVQSNYGQTFQATGPDANIAVAAAMQFCASSGAPYCQPVGCQ